jgi:hypothetical protein
MGASSSAVMGRRGFGAFEVLEARQLLAAVTAQLNWGHTNESRLSFQVTYSSDRPIDLASINGDELRLVKSGGGLDVVPRLHSATIGPLANTAEAVYIIDAPASSGLWGFADNGRYVVQLIESTVRNNSEEGNAAASVHTFSLWFAAPSIGPALSERLDVYGRGYTGLPDASGRVAVSDEARLDVPYIVASLPGFAQRTLIARIVGPNGFEQTQRIVTPNTLFSPRLGGGYEAVIPVRFTPPGLTWDTSDAGPYTVTVQFESMTNQFGQLVAEPVRVSETFDVMPVGVNGEMASVSITTGQMLVTMRYSHPSGINVATVGTGDVKVSIPGQGLFTPTLVGTPQVQDGVVTAVYRMDEPAGGWESVSGAKVLVRTGLGEVRATNGESIGFAVSRTMNVAAGGRVTGSVKSAYTTATKLVVVMRYGSDQALDPATLGGDDLRLTGPFGYNRLGDLVQVLPQANGEVLGVYHFDAPNITWDFRNDNGSYDLTMEPGAVREVNGGDENVAGHLKRFGLWFNNPVVDVITPAHVFHGTAVTDGMFDNTDAARIVLRYTTRDYRTAHVLNHTLSARITGPNGFATTQTLRNNWVVPYRSQGWGDVTEVDLRFAPPGGGWDSTDSGVYSITVFMNPTAGNPATEVLLQQEVTVNVDRPRAELVTMVTSSTAITAVVRYDSAIGIDASALGSSDLLLINRINGIGFQQSWAITLTASLVGTPVAGPNGSVTATYRFTAPNDQPWLGMERASLVVKPSEVRDTAGNAIGAALLNSFAIPPAQPDVISTGTLTATRTAWEVEVILRNDRGLIQTGSLQASNLIVSAPDGRATRVFMTSFVTALDGTLRVRYKITSPISGSWLANGAYTLALAPNSISQGLAGYLPATTLGTFNMTFT